jgi:pimeloyl-ACP methyl ester carboxylesterase
MKSYSALAACLLFLAPFQARCADSDAIALVPSSLCASPNNPVAFAGYLPIGGIEQWVTVRGAKCGQPIVLVLHGGPGNALSPYADALFGGLESEFTVVQWDQRGAGRTFGRNPGTAEASLTLPQMTADGVAVATQVAAALGQEKVILLGGSWGAALAVHMAKARPDAFHAYVGAGQLVDERDNGADSVARLRVLAEAGGDAQTLAMLDSLGTPPWTNPRAFGQLRRATRVYEAKSTLPAPAQWWKPAADYATPADFAAAEAADEYSYIEFVGMKGGGMLSQVDLAALGTDFPLPITLIQGEHDLVTTKDVSRRWFDTLQAPQKHFVLLANTGHDPNEEMLAAEVAALRRIRSELMAAEPAR